MLDAGILLCRPRSSNRAGAQQRSQLVGTKSRIPEFATAMLEMSGLRGIKFTCEPDALTCGVFHASKMA
jgi:hypothetical protein